MADISAIIELTAVIVDVAARLIGAIESSPDRVASAEEIDARRAALRADIDQIRERISAASRRGLAEYDAQTPHT